MTCSPPPPIIVERLTRDQLRTAYPLMRQAAPALSLAQWLRYARRLAGTAASASAGILVARRDGAAHPSGAVCYHRDSQLDYGCALTAEHFIALDALFPEAILSALLTELDGVAASLGCSAIRSIVNGRPADEALLEELRSAGYRKDGVTLLKMLPQNR